MSTPESSTSRVAIASHVTDSTPDPDPPVALRRPAPGPNAAELRAFGRAARVDVPRAAHGDWAVPADRPDPVALLQEQAQTRIPELVPIRYGRMLASPLTFLRGAALVMTADLARLPTSGIYTQLCGDAHLSNFGVFATPERRLVFDLNDFDETSPGPFEWDVKRLAASIALASQTNGFDSTQTEAATSAAIRTYRETTLSLADLPYLDAWYTRIDVPPIIEQIEKTSDKRTIRNARKLISKASTRTNLGSLQKFAERTPEGRWRIRQSPPLITSLDPAETGADGRLLGAVLQEAYIQYRTTLRSDVRVLLSQFTFADVARKVVGVGSVGTGAYVLLAIGPHGDDPLFLQIKEAQASVLERYTDGQLDGDQNGERVVAGQRLMQAASDQFLGWLRIDGLARPYDFYVRQLRDWKASLEIDQLGPLALAAYASVCGEALARAHARSGSSPAIAGYLGKSTSFDSAITRFALAYAAQSVADHGALAAAAADGRIAVRTDY